MRIDGVGSVVRTKSWINYLGGPNKVKMSHSISKAAPGHVVVMIILGLEKEDGSTPLDLECALFELGYKRVKALSPQERSR